MYTEILQEQAGKLLESHQVGCVIGYEVGPRGKTRPAFVRSADQAARLVWNEHCTHNLVGFIKGQLGQTKQRVAVVVKPCDSRAINVLLAENRFEREQVHVIGVACEGVAADHGEGKLQSRCEACELTAPLVFDELIGSPVERQPAAEHMANEKQYAWLEQASAEQRMDFWLRQFDRCIRCYACRQACPMCSCPTCLFERDDALWIGGRAGIQEKRTFHLGRAFHLAGRCVGCNECERVCPMDIPVRLLNQFIAREIEVQYQHRAGFQQVPSPLTTILGEKE